MARFNKKKMMSALDEKADFLQKKWQFEKNNGTAQLKDGDIDRAVAYGEWRALRNLAEQINCGRIGA
jgi:hypothetical protein